MTKTNLYSLLLTVFSTGALLFCHESVAQNVAGVAADTVAKSEKLQITGVVTDAATKKSLAGVRITVKDFSASISGDDGSFTLNVPSLFTDIEINAEGYERKQLSLKGSSKVAIALLGESIPSFQEEVVLPFGKIKKRNSTAAVTGYDANSEWSRPFENSDALLQGKIAGLNVIRRSGTPGIGANLYLRGYNSLYGTNAPLIVVDGVLYDGNDYGPSIIANNFTNPLTLISVQDIDNYTVIKDASSIYGTKGANGAIIITTSRAKEQATSIDFATYTGFNEAPEFLPVMNPFQYRIYLNQILQTSGLTDASISAMPYMNDDTTGNPDYYRYHNNTNWQRNVFRNSLNQNYHLKVTGGDNIATYALSVGYSKNTGVIRNTDLTKYNTRFNAEFNFSKKFTGVVNLAFTYTQNNLKYQGVVDKTAPLYNALVKSPFLTANEVNSKGVFSPNYEDTDILGVSNPSVLIDNSQALSRYYRFAGSYTFNYKINNVLTASTLFGVVYDKARENIFIPRKGVANDTTENAVIDSRLGSQVKRLFSIFSDTRLEFKKSFSGKHHFASRLGLRYQHNNAEQDFTLGFNSATDELISVQNGLPALRQVGGGLQEWNWMNSYFNADYDFKEKLFVSFNMAMDGSSRFGSHTKSGITMGGARFALMPSIGAAWILSSEGFMRDSRIDLLKLRVNYSITGNDDIGNYTHRQTYNSQNLLGMQGLVRSGISNPAIQWEASRKLNAGVDLAFWNERINLSVDVHKNKTVNMLVYEPVPSASGFEDVLTNSGSMQNVGIEAALNMRLVNVSKLKWDIGFTIASNDNKVLSVPGGKITTQYAGANIVTQNSRQSALFYGYIAQGVFSTENEAAASGLKKRNTDGSFSNFKAGDVRFFDVNKDRIIDEKDMGIIGIPTPEFFGSVNTHLEMGRFSIDALFTFSQGNDIFNYLRYKLESASSVENQLNSVANRWRAEGQKTDMPKATFGDPMGNNRFSTRWIEDGSYIRLRNASVTYAIPFKEKFIKNASVYLSGTNLFTITKYMGFDPEFSASSSLFAQGIDTGLDPLFKSITLGLRMGL